MKYHPTFRLRTLLAFYSGISGFIIFEIFSWALSYIWSGQYFCIYEFFSSRNAIVYSIFAITGFFILPSYFVSSSYNVRRTFHGAILSFSIGILTSILFLSIPQIGNVYFPLENMNLLQILLAKNGIYIGSQYAAQATFPTDKIYSLAIYCTIGLLTSSSIGCIVTLLLYRFTSKNNTDHSYWKEK